MGGALAAPTVYVQDHQTCHNWTFSVRDLVWPSQWLPDLQDTVLVDQSDYCEDLRRKLLQLREMVDANSIRVATLTPSSLLANKSS